MKNQKLLYGALLFVAALLLYIGIVATSILINEKRSHATVMARLADSCKSQIVIELAPDDKGGYALVKAVWAPLGRIDTNNTYIVFDLEDPCAEPDTFFYYCPETQPRPKKAPPAKKVVKKVEKPVPEIKPVIEPPQAPLDTTETFTDVPVSLVVEKITSDATTTILDQRTMLLYGSKSGFSYTDLVHLGDLGAIGQLDLHSLFSGQDINLKVVQSVDGREYLLFDRKLNIPVGKMVPGKNSIVFTQEFAEEHLIPGHYEIDLHMKKWAKAEIWTGTGILAGAVISEVILRFQPDIVYQDYNGVGNFNSANPFLQENLDEQQRGKQQTAWQIANYAGMGLGSVLIWDGHRRDKKATKWIPEKVTYENYQFKVVWTF